VIQSYCERFNQDEIKAVHEEWKANYQAMRYV
jgi:hypothetical protein